jgi:hypothetical protein
MERLEDRVGPDGKAQEAWRQSMGRIRFVTVNTEVDAPRKVTRTIEDDGKFFSGSWEHVVEPLGEGRSRLTITERGKVPGAIPRR